MIIENKNIVDLNDFIDTSCNTNTSYLYKCRNPEFCKRYRNYNCIDYNNNKLNLELIELEKGYLLSIPKEVIDNIKKYLVNCSYIFKCNPTTTLYNIKSSNFLCNKFFNCFINNNGEDTNKKLKLFILTLRWLVKYRDDNPEAPYLDLDNKYNINISLKIKEYPICSDSYIRSVYAKYNILMISMILARDILCMAPINKRMFVMGSFCIIEIYRIFRRNKKITEAIIELLASATNPDNTKEEAINSRDEIKDFMNAIVERYKYISYPIAYR